MQGISGRSFILSIVGVLALGGVIGGAFTAGLVVSGGPDDESTPSVLTLPTPGTSAAEPDPRNRDASNVLNPPTPGPSAAELKVEAGDDLGLDEVIRQIEAAFGGGGDIKIQTLGAEDVGGVAGTGRDKGFAGTVQQVQEGRITINTPYGPLEAAIGPETVIQRTEVSILTVDELREGLEVQIVGQPNEAGFLEATEIFVVPQ